MRRTTSAWLLPTSDKTLKQLLSYLLWWEKSLWPHYDQIRQTNRAQSHSFFTPDRQSIGPSGDTNHITVFTETDVMIVEHKRLGLTRLSSITGPIPFFFLAGLRHLNKTTVIITWKMLRFHLQELQCENTTTTSTE